MQEYERIINYFFHHFNITFKVPTIEKKTIISTDCYSIDYCLNKEPISYSNPIIRFCFFESDLMLKSAIVFNYTNQIQFDNSHLYDKIKLGLKCIEYLNRKNIRNYSNIIKITAHMNKTKLVDFTDFSNTLLISTSPVKVTRFEIINKVEDLVNIELDELNVDADNISLNDKLDLLGMVLI